MSRRLSKEVWERRVSEAGAGRYEFVRWLFDDKFGSNHKCVVRCVKDGCAWASKANNLVDGGSGCPLCAGKIRWTADERIEDINSLENIEFVSWVGEYKNHRSKANVRCLVDNFEWSVEVNSAVNCGRGCPKCAKNGYDQSKLGHLYALRSECGRYVKVGISNNPSQRHKQLERSTPFSFKVLEEIEGNGAFIAELERHLKSKYNRAGLNGFDGYTEWLICTSGLLEELRNLRGKL